MTGVEPKPAASVMLVRAAAAPADEPIEVYMIRRQRGMKFLGGYYAFPGGKVEVADGVPEALSRSAGLDPGAAAALFGGGPPPALAYWLTGIRELLEESGILLACDAAGVPIDGRDSAVRAAIDESRRALLANEATLAELLAARSWWADTRRLTYVSHFVTPRSSPIRFSARFFVCHVPADQPPRLFTEETSEGLWIGPAMGHRRFVAGEMAMAEPAEYGLAYLAQFASLAELDAAHAEAGERFHGIVHRIDTFWEGFDWQANRWTR